MFSFPGYVTSKKEGRGVDDWQENAVSLVWYTYPPVWPLKILLKSFRDFGYIFSYTLFFVVDE